MKEKKPEDYVMITQEYSFICVCCEMKHPTKTEKCFKCGSLNSIVVDKPTTKQKRKSTQRGATLRINL
jgi:predicted ATP-dependent serine protease